MMCKAYFSLLTREEGQGMVEYGLIITFVVLAVIGAVYVLGLEVGVLFEHIGNRTREVL